MKLSILFLTALLLVGVTSAYHTEFGLKSDDRGRAYSSQFIQGVYTPIAPLTPYVDPTVRIGGFFGGGDLYLAGLRAGYSQEPYPAINYGQRVGWGGNYYPRFPIGWIREGGYFGERGVNLKGSPNAPGSFVFGGSKGRGDVFSGFN